MRKVTLDPQEAADVAIEDVRVGTIEAGHIWLHVRQASFQIGLGEWKQMLKDTDGDKIMAAAKIEAIRIALYRSFIHVVDDASLMDEFKMKARGDRRRDICLIEMSQRGLQRFRLLQVDAAWQAMENTRRALDTLYDLGLINAAGVQQATDIRKLANALLQQNLEMNETVRSYEDAHDVPDEKRH